MSREVKYYRTRNIVYPIVSVQEWISIESDHFISYPILA